MNIKVAAFTLSEKSINIHYAPDTCNHGPTDACDRGDRVGLNYLLSCFYLRMPWHAVDTPVFRIPSKIGTPQHALI